MFQRSKKFIALVILVGLLIPSFSSALSLGANPVPTSDAETHCNLVGGTGGLVDSLLNPLGDGCGTSGTLNVVSQFLQAAPCMDGATEAIINGIDQVSQWGFGGLSLLTSAGQVAQAAKIKVKIAKLNVAAACFSARVSAMRSVSPISVVQAQQIQSMLDLDAKQMVSIKARLDDLTAQYTLATQNVWKTILIATLLNLTKSITMKIANTLVNKFKVNDVARYTDALASQVYTAQKIMDYAPSNKQDQMMVKSFVDGPLFGNGIRPDVRMRSNMAIANLWNTSGGNNSVINTSDPNFYNKVYQTAAFMPGLQQLKIQDAADGAKSQGQVSASAEVAMSQGFKAPRNCKGTVSDQQAISGAYSAAVQKYEDRYNLYLKLTESKDQGLPVKQADIDQAYKDMTAAQNDVIAMPNGVQSPVVKVCESIASPSEMINKGVDKVLSQFVDNMGQYNNNNLPFFVKFISQIGSDLTGNLLFGGNKGAKLVADLSAGANPLASDLTAMANSFQDQANSTSTPSAIKFDYQTNTNSDPTATSTTYTLAWDASSVENAASTNLQGPNVSATGLPVTGSYVVPGPAGSGYILSVVDSTGQVTAQATLDIPAVQGAYTSKPYQASAQDGAHQLDIRGP